MIHYMKKFLNSALVIAAAFVCLIPVACQKENKVVSLDAKICSPNDSKVYISQVTPYWVNGDQVFINTASYAVSSASSTSAVIANVAEASPYRAIYPASIVTSSDISSSNSVAVTLPRTQFYATTSGNAQLVPVPMGAYITSGSRLQFHNLCSLVKVNITNSYNNSFTLSGIEMYAANSSLSGTGTATVSGSESDGIQMATWSATSTNTSKAVTLSFVDVSGNELVSGASTIVNGENNAKSFYIICPAFSSQKVTFQLLVGGNLFAKFELSDKALSANSIANVNLVVTRNEVIELSDLFSVSANQQVQFSKGNLQYQASSSSWRFAPQQYDVIGAAAGNTTASSSRSSQSDFIDLFNYGCSGQGTDYPPYSLSAHYTGSIEGTNYDWGVKNNTALNNTLAATDPLKTNTNTWRTLTNAEWAYLITDRGGRTSTVNGVENVSYAKATVCGQPGLLLFPDVFVWPPSVDVYPLFNVNSALFESTSYNAQQWAALEAMNVIFLPTCGHRLSESSSVEYVTSRGLYWSSTITDRTNDAYIFQFKDTSDGHNETNARAGQPGQGSMGRAVRLVKNAASSTSSK